MNRRHVLEALAATSVCATASPLEAITRLDAQPDNYSPSRRWYLARLREKNCAGHVDFWSQPVCNIRHTAYLPGEIARGILYCDNLAQTSLVERDKVELIDSLLPIESGERGYKFEQFIGNTDLSSPLLPLFEAGGVGKGRLALVALNSGSYKDAETRWIDVLQVLRRHYSTIIGHFHINERSFRLWRDGGANRRDDGNVTHQFLKAASLCDATFLTCSSLIENDTNLSARDSIEVLVGQLMRPLGYALLDDCVLQEILSWLNRSKSNIFALTSLTSTISSPEISMRDLCRQRELILAGFGDWDAGHNAPLLITPRGGRHSVQAISDQVQGTDLRYMGRIVHAEPASTDPLQTVQHIVLWPSDTDASTAAFRKMS